MGAQAQPCLPGLVLASLHHTTLMGMADEPRPAHCPCSTTAWCSGRFWLSNPDLPKRFLLDAPLNKYDR